MERAEMAQTPRRRCNDTKTVVDYLYMAAKILAAGALAYFVLRERIVVVETRAKEQDRRLTVVEVQVSEIAAMKTDIRWIRETLERR